MWIVAAFTLDGQPYGSVKVATAEEANRAAARYITNPKIGRVRATEVRDYPAIARGNGRYR